jgi:hypothetical protein
MDIIPISEKVKKHAEEDHGNKTGEIALYTDAED